MRKLFPMPAKPTTWYNYSNYLNWMYEKIQGWEEYLNFFSPEYQIVNETLLAKDVIKNTDEKIEENKEVTPYWIYIVKKDKKGEDGEDIYVRNYCFFPSELRFRQGYINIFPKAYLCYFSPPNAYNRDITSHEINITETEWNALVDSGKIHDFPPSRLVFSKTNAHGGSHFSGNLELQDPNKYLIISKPSASWYVPTFTDGGVVFNFIKNALEDSGSIVPLTFEFAPSRYILVERTKKKDQTLVPVDEAKWLAEQTSWSYAAAGWDSNSGVEAANNIQTIDRKLWTASYPLMHNLELRVNITRDSNLQVIGYDCEDIITDDGFYSWITNVNNHTTAKYSVNLNATVDEVSTLWDNIFVNIC